MKKYKEKGVNAPVDTAEVVVNEPVSKAKSPKNTSKKPKSPKSPKRQDWTTTAISCKEGELSTFSDKISKQSPDIIQQCIERCVKPKKKAMLKYHYCTLDMIILTIIGVISGALPNYRFYYRGTWYYSSLMLIIVAVAGFGKGIMDAIFSIIDPIHKMYRDEFHEKLAAYNKQQELLAKMTTKERKEYTEDILEKPQQLFFRIPADSTYAAFMKALVSMDGRGVILDTEIDTLAQTLSSEIGNYSVFIRKNFKHESHRYYRKTDDEYCEIPEPKFGQVISGTMSQMKNFITDVLDGFFSRFSTYWAKAETSWIDEVEAEDNPKDDKTFYSEIGDKFLVIFKKLSSLEQPIRFRLTSKQLDKFNRNFSRIYDTYKMLDGEDIHSSVVRTAVVFHRIAMVLSISRLIGESEDVIDKALSEDIICLDKDFNTAMTIITVLMEHQSAYFEEITRTEPDMGLNEKTFDYDAGDEKVISALQAIPVGVKITTSEILETFISKGIPKSTASKKVATLTKRFVFDKVAHGIYKKSSPEDFLIKKEEAKKAKKAMKKAGKPKK